MSLLSPPSSTMSINSSTNEGLLRQWLSTHGVACGMSFEKFDAASNTATIKIQSYSLAIKFASSMSPSSATSSSSSTSVDVTTISFNKRSLPRQMERMINVLNSSNKFVKNPIRILDAIKRFVVPLANQQGASSKGSVLSTYQQHPGVAGAVSEPPLFTPELKLQLLQEAKRDCQEKLSDHFAFIEDGNQGELGSSVWKAMIFGFEGPISENLSILESVFQESNVEFELNFDVTAYPMQPPVITLLKPKFSPEFQAKVATMNCLKFWSPFISVVDILQSLYDMINSGSEIIDMSEPHFYCTPLETSLHQLQFHFSDLSKLSTASATENESFIDSFNTTNDMNSLFFDQASANASAFDDTDEFDGNFYIKVEWPYGINITEQSFRDHYIDNDCPVDEIRISKESTLEKPRYAVIKYSNMGYFNTALELSASIHFDSNAQLVSNPCQKSLFDGIPSTSNNASLPSGSGATSAATSTKSGAIVQGDSVVLSNNYATITDAKSGPLKPGDIGLAEVISGNGYSSGSIQARAPNGKTWYYSAGALVKSKSPFLAKIPAKIPATTEKASVPKGIEYSTGDTMQSLMVDRHYVDEMKQNSLSQILSNLVQEYIRIREANIEEEILLAVNTIKKSCLFQFINLYLVDSFEEMCGNQTKFGIFRNLYTMLYLSVSNQNHGNGSEVIDPNLDLLPLAYSALSKNKVFQRDFQRVVVQMDNKGGRQSGDVQLKGSSKLSSDLSEEEDIHSILADLIDRVNTQFSFCMENIASGGSNSSSNESSSSSGGGAGNVSKAVATVAGSPTTAGLQEEYVKCMNDLLFEQVEDESFPSFHYATQMAAATSGSRERMKKLKSEYAALLTPGSLPVSWSSSIWVRGLESRMDALQVMISGPEGTPYQNGLFLFDIFFPNEYPAAPPKVNLQTTGKGTVRFNPNLYNCGKVCLSLLGTWQGSADEMWNAKTSTLLQVLISIQSAILIDEPYFNEPGYQSSRGTPHGSQNSKNYNVVIEKGTVQWGIIDMIQHPPKGFEQVVKEHFRHKSNEITKQVESWSSCKDLRSPLKEALKNCAIAVAKSPASSSSSSSNNSSSKGSSNSSPSQQKSQSHTVKPPIPLQDLLPFKMKGKSAAAEPQAASNTMKPSSSTPGKNGNLFSSTKSSTSPFHFGPESSNPLIKWKTKIQEIKELFGSDKTDIEVANLLETANGDTATVLEWIFESNDAPTDSWESMPNTSGTAATSDSSTNTAAPTTTSSNVSTSSTGAPSSATPSTSGGLTSTSNTINFSSIAVSNNAVSAQNAAYTEKVKEVQAIVGQEILAESIIELLDMSNGDTSFVINMLMG